MKALSVKTSVLALSACSLATMAQTPPPDPASGGAEADAQALVDAVLVESLDDILAVEHEALAAWAQAIIDEALGRGPGSNGPVLAGESTGPAAAQDFSGNGAAPGIGANTVEVLVFMSLAVPERSWRQWSAQAARIGAPMVLRGVVEGGLEATVRAIQGRGPQDGAAIDPRLFRLFRIGSVPAVAVVPGGVPPCTSPGCSADPPPPHDLVTGNIGLDGALEAIATQGGPGRATARRHLGVLRGETH